MMKKHFLLPVLMIVTFLSSCKHDRKDQLCRKWQATAVISKEFEDAIAGELASLDTLGGHTDTSVLRRIYGTSDVQQIRIMARSSITKRQQDQDALVAATWFQFDKDGKLVMHAPRGITEANWKFIGNDALEIKKDGLPARQWKISLLSDTALYLVTQNETMTYNVRFRPAAN